MPNHLRLVELIRDQAALHTGNALFQINRENTVHIALCINHITVGQRLAVVAGATTTHRKNPTDPVLPVRLLQEWDHRNCRLLLSQCKPSFIDTIAFSTALSNHAQPSTLSCIGMK